MMSATAITPKASQVFCRDDSRERLRGMVVAVIAQQGSGVDQGPVERGAANADARGSPRKGPVYYAPMPAPLRSDTPRAGSAEPSKRSALVVLGVWALLAIPFVVALVALHRYHWYPLLDLAQTELRIRDVTSAHPPLVGLPGRIGAYLQGSHPGPLSFWALAPFYRLFGATAWAMEAAAAALNVAAIGLALWIAKRRGGIALVLGVGAALALLTRFYGPSLLTQAWNPYMPMLWFPVLVLAVWAVLCEDWMMLPVAVFAGSFCVQTHISYALLVSVLLLVALVALVHAGVRDRAVPESRRRVIVWGGVAVGLGVLLWLPPIIQELRGADGNLTIIWNYFTNPPESPIGLRAGAEQMLVHLNPWRLLAQQDATSGSIVPGLLFGAVWLGGAVLAGWRRKRDEWKPVARLDLVLALSLVLGTISISRIFGFVWYYLMLWSWTLTVLMLLTIVWSAALVVRERRSAAAGADVDTLSTNSRIATALVAGIAVLAVIGFAVDASSVHVPEERISRLLAALAPPTVRALESGQVTGGGKHGHYLVTFTDTVNIGAPFYGLILELERQGFDVGATDVFHVIVAPHRVMHTEKATATVHFARGPNIAVWRKRPGYKEVAHVDLRTPKERAEYARIRARVIPELKRLGFDDLVPLVDENVFVVTFDPRLPPALKHQLELMLGIGQPAAIFVGPPTAAD